LSLSKDLTNMIIFSMKIPELLGKMKDPSTLV
jgi:hypothetical protein